MYFQGTLEVERVYGENALEIITPELWLWTHKKYNNNLLVVIITNSYVVLTLYLETVLN